MNRRQQHRHIAALQKRWRADALRDAKYNQERARQERKAGNRILARGYTQESAWDIFWGNRRGKIIRREQRLGK